MVVAAAARIAPAVLESILSTAREKMVFPQLLVGTETSDDAAVYRLNDEQAIVATTDFSCPSWMTPSTLAALLPPMRCRTSTP
jgi:selenophosphate synthase